MIETRPLKPTKSFAKQSVERPQCSLGTTLLGQIVRRLIIIDNNASVKHDKSRLAEGSFQTGDGMESVDDFIRSERRKNENKIVSFSTWNELRSNSISSHLVFPLFFLSLSDFKMFYWLIVRWLCQVWMIGKKKRIQ